MFDINAALKIAPFFTPTMPKTGREFSVKMTNMGNVGWVSDKESGYRYQKTHPVTNKAWPPITKNILNIWHELTGLTEIPDCCLVNYYNQQAKMGLHVDNDEKDFSYPVLSISIGASALFRYGGLKRYGRTNSLILNHGDILIMGGKSRLFHHVVDKVYNGINSDRINLTMRKL